MPEPLRYLQAAATSLLVAAAWGVWHRQRSRSDANWYDNGQAALGFALAIAAGLAVVGIRPALPPRNALDRLLVVALPLVLLGELSTANWSRLRRFPWGRSCVVSALLPYILLHGSVYLRAESGGWTWLETTAWFGGLAGSHWLLGTTLTRLAVRTNVAGVAGSLAAAIQAGGLLIMLGGYLKGGAASFPLAAAVCGIVGLSWGREPVVAASVIRLGATCLWGLLVIGRFFGGVSTSPALIVWAAPMVGGLVAWPAWGREHPRWRLAAQLLLVTLPLAVLLVRAEGDLRRKLGPKRSARPERLHDDRFHANQLSNTEPRS